MHKFLSLLKVLMKNNLNFITDGKTKNIWKYLLLGLFTVVFIPYLYVLYQLFDTYFEAFTTINQSGSVVALGFYLCAMLIFFFSVFIIPGIFYFSKDNTTLLSLPLKPQTIIAAKFFNSVIYEYLFSFFVMIPLFFAYANHMNVGIWEILMMIIIALTIPIIPLVYSTAISMIIMRFTPFMKNKDMFNLVSSVIIVIAALSMSFYFSNSMANDPTALMTMLMEGKDSLIPIFSTFFPFVDSACNSLLHKDFLETIIYFAWNISAVVILLILGKYIYFKGAIGINESSKNSKKVNLQKSSKQTSVMYSYILKEMRMLIRTPIYLMNCVFSAFIFTILFFVFVFQSQSSELLKMLPIDTFTSSSAFPAYFILGTIIISCFLSTINMISGTSISREGDHVSFMKFIPVSYGNQILAKATIGIIIGILSILPIWIFASWSLKVSVFTLFLSFIAMLTTSIASNFICIIIDVMHPKLIWEQEAAAVKQNMNGMISMAIGALFAAVMFAVMFYVPQSALMIVSLVIVILFIAVSILLYFYIQKKASKLFAKIS